MKIKFSHFQRPSLNWQATQQLRFDVFVTEQSVPESLEIDELDKTAEHFIAKDSNKIIATLRIVKLNNTAKLGRLAVAKAYRHKKIATRLITYAEDYCRQQGIDVIQLGAQITAKDFYKRLGYKEYGDIFIDAGIPHISMRKAILRAIDIQGGK